MRYDWNDLKFFLEVVRGGTLSAAARALSCDHVTVGRRVVALEQALGASLFHRSAGGHMLTPAGATLLGFAERVEAATFAAAEALDRPELGISGKVKLATPDGFGNYFLAKYLGEFAQAYPLLTLELITVPQILSLSQREGDVTVSLAPPNRGKFKTEKLTDYDLSIYAGQGYLDRCTAPLRRDTLRSHRFVGYVDDLIFSRELDYLGEIAPGLRAQLQSTSLLAQATATSRGDGLCVLPNFVANETPGLTRVVPEVSLRRTYWMNCHDEVADLPRVRALRNFIGDICRQRGRFIADD
ncbi:MAG: hypothetical protein JWR51_235 [Devosia sp.]|uniref:LysR family transcriptional regulator n=1 Tax=Devosia sp. TaxID=1871048 RepID=UPI00262C166F|nr:LysR family transcriptional regulator [Devosia sp.]MDB5527132.1 hypothetical protein [Devosia sp.]